MKEGQGITYGQNQKIIATYANDVKNGPYQIFSSDNNYYEKGTFLNG